VISLGNIFSGVKAALFGGDPGAHMDMSRAAFPKSFYALIAAGFLILAAVLLGSGAAANVSPALTVIAITLYFLTAPTVIYTICHLLSKPELFRPWIIVRNWLTLFVSIAIFVLAGLSALSPAPAGIAGSGILLLWIATLLADIRLAQTLVKQDWTPAIFIACGISVAGMLVLLAVFASASGY